MWKTVKISCGKIISFMTAVVLVFCSTLNAENPENSAPLNAPLASTPSSQTDSKPESKPLVQTQITAIQPFTGRILANRVRLRTSPSLDGPIIKELGKDDLFVVVGEKEEFYAVAAPKDLKAYVFRTFVLDNVVEGSRVNVRSEPSLDAPIIAQLNSGDHIDGVISEQNNKWIEMTPPKSARFFIAKEYIEKIGDMNLYSHLEKKQEEAKATLANAIKSSQEELQRPFEKMNLNPVFSSLEKLISDPDNVRYSSELVNRAVALQKTLQDTYLQKKLAFLESKPQGGQQGGPQGGQQGGMTQNTQQSPENKVESGSFDTKLNTLSSDASWQDRENAFFNEWKKGQKEESKKTTTAFYNQEKESAVQLKGYLEPFNRPVKNRPGDFVLIDRNNHLPIGYLYSTLVNLNDYLGSDVTVQVVERPNNHFAYPAYLVLEISR